jgi:soluble lytic murein transglycosylase-like protein
VIETGLNPRPPRGAAGEIGTFQVMPATARAMAERCGVKGNPANEAVSAKLAYCYVELVHGLSGGDWYATVAAYNAGPSAIIRVKRYGMLPSVTANYLYKFNRLMERTNACRK